MRSLLASYEAEGQRSDEGAFTLDPGRAIEMLRAQGRLGQNAPLYLLSAIHQHTAGEAIRKSSGFRTLRLTWPGPHGPLPPSLAREIAESSFAAHQVQLVFQTDGVMLKPQARAAELFEQVAERLEHYPWHGRSGLATSPLGQATLDQAEILIRLPTRGWSLFEHVVHGITFATRWALPIDAVCFDPRGRADLGLNAIADSDRRQKLMAAAEDLFVQLLQDSLDEAPPVVFDPHTAVAELPLFAAFLPFAVRQSRDPDLAARAASRTCFQDVAGHSWTTTQLLDAYQRDGKLLFIPNDVATAAAGRPDRPVLLWGGRAAEVGSALFPVLAPGEGYLYSLAVNERERQRRVGDRPLASRALNDGRLSLLPWGDPDRTAEVEFVGPRRARETFYLDAEAPKGLRLLWESEHSLEESMRELALDGALRHVVMELIDASLSPEAPSRETLLTALLWALRGGPLDWSRLARLAQRPLLEDAAGGLVCLNEVFDHAAGEEGLWVLTDRSGSLPRTLPVSPLVWWHPLLDRLGLATNDAGRLVREAHWRQVGQESWLSAHSPKPPDWPPLARPRDGHLWARNPNPTAPTEVLFWKLGRPFGRRVLPTSECPPGYLLTWVEDDLPGDSYWSGPDPAALRERLPAIARLCREDSSRASSPDAL